MGSDDDATLTTSSILAGSVIINKLNSDATFTLDATAIPYNVNIAGNWSNGGTFTPRTSTVTFNGTNQSISGTTTFNNVTKNVTTAATFTFASSTTQTIQGTMNLQGIAGNLLSLRSNLTGTQWKIDPQATRTISYLDVKDSWNVNATSIAVAGFNITNSGNNTGWLFNLAPNAPSSLGPANYVDGSWGNDNTPTLQFTQSDSDASDTLKYRIQIDDSSDFGSLVIDYTSALAVQGSASFTVGQAAGSGSYATGSEGQTLSNS